MQYGEIRQVGGVIPHIWYLHDAIIVYVCARVCTYAWGVPGVAENRSMDCRVNPIFALYAIIEQFKMQTCFKNKYNKISKSIERCELIDNVARILF